MGHPGKAGTTVGVEKHQVSSATAKKGSHPIPSHPIPSHPIPSHPILSRTSSHPTSPHPTLRTQRARAASTHNEETRRAGSFHGGTDSRDGHVPSAKACQVPGRAKCQGARPKDARGKQDKHGEHAQRAHTTRRRDAQADSTEARSQRSRAKCQGVPSAKASQVPRRQAGQPPRRDATRKHQRRTHSRDRNARRLTEARTHVPSAKKSRAAKSNAAGAHSCGQCHAAGRFARHARIGRAQDGLRGGASRTGGRAHGRARGGARARASRRGRPTILFFRVAE